MKLRNLIRWQLILAGLGAALFMTPSAQSQEITNTTFDDGPYVTTFAQSGDAQPSAQVAPVQATAPSVNEVAAIQASLAPPRAALIDSPRATVALTLLLLACVALSVLGYAKRSSHLSNATRRYPSYRGA